MSEQGAPVPPPVAPQESTVKAAGKSIGKRILIYIVLGVVVAGGYFAYKYLSGDITTAKVGDCVTATVGNDAPKVVDCTKPEAKQKVASIIEDKYTYSEFDKLTVSPCAGGDQDAYFQGTTSKGGTEKKGDVWCLVAK